MRKDLIITLVVALLVGYISNHLSLNRPLTFSFIIISCGCICWLLYHLFIMPSGKLLAETKKDLSVQQQKLVEAKQNVESLKEEATRIRDVITKLSRQKHDVALDLETIEDKKLDALVTIQMKDDYIDWQDRQIRLRNQFLELTRYPYEEEP